MGWSFTLGRIAGTEVRIHLTFFLLVAWFGITAGLEGGAEETVQAILLVLAIFACVLAHEFGHVLTARAYGIGTRDITLLPIGGVARIETMPKRPLEELVIAVAGPVVNVVIATALVVLFGVSLDLDKLTSVPEGRLDFLTHLALVNVALVAFNLLPAFPMDGGRVLRALLSMRFDRARATRIAASIGQAVAFALGFLGLFGNPLLVFIAIFVFIAASHESYAVELEEATQGVRTTDATITSFQALETHSTVGQAVSALLATSQREFPVIDGRGHLVGLLTRDGMIRALSDSGPATPVSDVMERDIPVINRRAPLSDAVSRMHSSGQPAIGVIDDSERVVGILTLENLAEFMLVKQAVPQCRYGT